MSFPGSSDNWVEPALTDAHRDFIESEIRKYFVGGTEVKVEVVVLNGEKRFVALRTSEKVEAEFEVAVRVVRNGKVLGGRKFLGHAMMGVTRLDASASSAETIYLKVIAASIEKCLKALIVETDA